MLPLLLLIALAAGTPDDFLANRLNRSFGKNDE
jgi:hypothetical protein